MDYSLSRATTWNIVGYIYLIIASLVSTPVIVHSLGIELFGTYILVGTATTFASALDLGLPAAVIRALSSKKVSNLDSVWSTSLVLFSYTGLAAGALVAVVLYLFHTTPSLIILSALIALACNVLSHYLTLPQAHGRFDLYNSKTFMVGTANTLFAALLASRGYGLSAIILAQLVAYLVTIYTLYRYSRSTFAKFSWYIDPLVSRELLSFGLKNQAGKIMGQLQAAYGKYLLAPFSSLAISAFGIAQGLILKSAGGITQLSTALYPASSRSPGTKALRKLYYQLQIGLFILGLLGVLLYKFFGTAFISWWLHDPTLSDSVDSVMKILIWYMLALILTPLASTILDSHGKPGVNSFFAFATVTFEIILAILLLPKYGILAPPIAALIAVYATTPALLLVAEKALQSKVE